MAGPQGKPALPGILNIRIGCAHSSKTLSPFDLVPAISDGRRRDSFARGWRNV